MLFKKKPVIAEVLPLFNEVEIDGATYGKVQDFLVSVNDADFAKIITIVKIYRKAHMDVANTTGVRPEQVPSIFDNVSISDIASDTEVGDFLNDDDLEKAFGPEPTPIATSAALTDTTRKKVEVKNDAQN